jgi:hypothetical protein
MNWENITLPTIESLNAKLEEYKNERKVILEHKRELFDKMFANSRLKIMNYIKERLEKSIDSHKADKHIIIYYNEGVTSEIFLPDFTSVECIDLYRECYPDITKCETLFDYIMIPIVQKLKAYNYKINMYQYKNRMAYIISWV